MGSATDPRRQPMAAVAVMLGVPRRLPMVSRLPHLAPVAMTAGTHPARAVLVRTMRPRLVLVSGRPRPPPSTHPLRVPTRPPPLPRSARPLQARGRVADGVPTLPLLLPLARPLRAPAVDTTARRHRPRMLLRRQVPAAPGIRTMTRSLVRRRLPLTLRLRLGTGPPALHGMRPRRQVPGRAGGGVTALQILRPTMAEPLPLSCVPIMTRIKHQIDHNTDFRLCGVL